MSNIQSGLSVLSNMQAEYIMSSSQIGLNVVLLNGRKCLASYSVYINALRTGDSCRSRRYLSTLLQEMAWRQIGANPFLEAMLILDRLQPYE